MQQNKISRIIERIIKISLNYQIIIMQRLFAISNTRTLQRLGLSPQTFPNFQKALLKNNIKPTGQNLLFRIPRDDFRILINTHCPINSLQSPNAQEIIKATKLLRHQAKLKQVKVCCNCRFLKNCRWAKRPLQNVHYDNTLRDLLIFLYGLQTLHLGQKLYFMYARVYKMNDYLMPIIDDLSKGGREFQLFCNTRETIINSYVQPKKISKIAQNTLNEEEELVKRAEEFQKASGLGRDFSFDQQSEFDRAHSKKQNVEQVQMEQKINQSAIKVGKFEQETLKVEQKVEIKEENDNQEIKSIQNRRRKRIPKTNYIQTDNLKLKVIRKTPETPDQSNHPRFDQLRRKIQLQHQQEQNLHPNLHSSRKQPTKPDTYSPDTPHKPTKHQKQQSLPPRK